MNKIPLHGSREFHYAVFTLRFERSACPVLWHLFTASLPTGDSCSLAGGGLNMKEVFYQTWNEHVKDCFHTSSFRFWKQPFLNTTLCTQRISHPSLHLLGNSNSQFCHSQAAPSSNFFLLSLLAIFIISTVVIQSDPCCAK